jgi:hypothetical protein
VAKQKLARSGHYLTSAGPAKAFLIKLAVCAKEKIQKSFTKFSHWPRHSSQTRSGASKPSRGVHRARTRANEIEEPALRQRVKSTAALPPKEFNRCGMQSLMN